MKFNQNCRVIFVRDSENNSIDKYNEYFVGEEANYEEEDRYEIDNDASDDEDEDSDAVEESNYDDDEYSGVGDSDDIYSLNDDDIHMDE